jgi:P27 family predicted phage terminase small subunit
VPEPLKPPWELKPAALEIFKRHADRLTSEGRVTAVDVDALAVYASTLATYHSLQAAVDEAGVLISGRSGELVKNPVLPALSSCRDSLMRLARAVPLVDNAAALESSRFDKWMDRIDAL